MGVERELSGQGREMGRQREEAGGGTGEAARQAEKDTRDKHTERKMGIEMVRPPQTETAHKDGKNVDKAWGGTEIQGRAKGFPGPPGEPTLPSVYLPTELIPW